MGLNNYGSDIVKAEKQRPYMQELSDSLDIQLKRLEEYIGRTNNVADRMKSTTSPITEPGRKEESLPGYLGTLSSKLDIMRVMNDRFEYLVNHLETCI